MGLSEVSRLWVALALGGLVMAAGCSSSDEPSSSSTTGPNGEEGSTAPAESAAAFTGHSPDEIIPPPIEGSGVVVPQPAAPLPEDYVEEEFFIGGTATSFDPGETPSDGFWTASPGDEAEYRTRVVVRRPENPDAFSGTVLVEWFNVSAIEAAPDWAYISEEIGREGHAYVGVSAQSQGVEGGDTILEVDVDTEAAAGAGVEPDASGLKNIDPERYGTLVHPGDAYAYDIFTQVGRAAHEFPDQLLGALEPEQVIAVGESQSAIFLSTLVNAVHPLDPVFDGFLIHSRGANVAALDGAFATSRGRDPEELMKQGVLLRTDLDVPVLIFEAEGDLGLLGYAYARQPDTDSVRTWEVAGTAHADAHTIRSIMGGPRDPSVGSLLGCTEPINAGPHHEVVQAALHHLVAWAAGGDPPPEGARIELVDGDSDEVIIARDENQIALGGVRNPLVDVPVAAYIGDPPNGESITELTEGGSICILFGQTIAFDQPTLVERYGNADAYVEAFRASAADAVAQGFLLRPDADQLIDEAEANRALFG